MKSWQYAITTIMGLACLGLSIAIVAISRNTISLQETIQERQAKLNSGILGPQAQQVTGNILQDMAAIASKDDKMRDLLAKYGFNVKPAQSSNAPAKVKEEK